MASRQKWIHQLLFEWKVSKFRCSRIPILPGASQWKTKIRFIVIRWTHYLFSDWLKADSDFSKSAPVTSSTEAADYTIIMSRTLKVTDNHVNFARFVLLAVSEEEETWIPGFWVQSIIKQLLDSVFVISRIIKASVRVIASLCQPSASADNPYTRPWLFWISQKPHPKTV